MQKREPTRKTMAALIVERDALKIELAKSQEMATKLAAAVLESERLEAKIVAAKAQTERRHQREARVQTEELANVTTKLLCLEWIVERLDTSVEILEAYWNAMDHQADELAGRRTARQ